MIPIEQQDRELAFVLAEFDTYRNSAAATEIALSARIDELEAEVARLSAPIEVTEDMVEAFIEVFWLNRNMVSWRVEPDDRISAAISAALAARGRK